jgi:hypothetical protein
VAVLEWASSNAAWFEYLFPGNIAGSLTALVFGQWG